MRASLGCWACVAAALLALAGAARAEDAPSFYVGALGGFTWVNQDGSRLSKDLQARGHNVTAAVDDTAHGAGVYGGWDITPRVALEAGALWLKQNGLAIAGSTGDVASFTHDLSQLRPVAGWSFSLAARARVPLAPDVALLPKLGGYWWTQKSTFDTGAGSFTDRDHGVGLLAGVALSWEVVRHLELGAGVELLRPRSHDLGAIAYGSVEYRFGGAGR